MTATEAKPGDPNEVPRADRSWRPYLILAVLDLVLFFPLVIHPSQVLYSDHSDVLAEHLPAKHFLVGSFHKEKELPRWNPHSLGGMPFLHDMQVAAFYPFHLGLLLLPEKWVGAALSWLTVFHVFLAGAAMHWYARGRGLAPIGAMVAAIGYMFAGKWMLHLLEGGHYITIGIAWLPIVMRFLEEALQSRSLVRATLAGVAFALLILCTHPQWIFYSALLVALWSYGAVLENAGYLSPTTQRDSKRLLRKSMEWLLAGVWLVVLAACLTAVQLLPTEEAGSYSSRSLGVEHGAKFFSSFWSVRWLAGPALTAEPANWMWDERGGFGILWLAFAAMAPFLGTGRTRYEAFLCLGLMFFSLGGAELFHLLPGFRLFRQPTRMFLLVSFAVAFLAGTAVDRLTQQPSLSAALVRRCRRRFLLMAIILFVLALVDLCVIQVSQKPVRLSVYWFMAPVLITVTLSLIFGQGSKRASRDTIVLPLLLLVDVWAIALPLVRVRPLEEIYPPSETLSFLTTNLKAGERVLDRDSLPPIVGSPLGRGDPVAPLYDLEPIRGFNPLDILRYKEFLQFVSGNTEPLRLFDSPLLFPIVADFPIQNWNLLSLLGVRYIVQPSDPRYKWAGEDRLSQKPSWRRVSEDKAPRAYDVIQGGVCEFPPFAVYENLEVLPRAFFVPKVERIDSKTGFRDPMRQLKAANFKETAFLESEAPIAPELIGSGEYRPAKIQSYSPNRIVVSSDNPWPSCLVLTNVWFPEWECTIDGTPARVYRANYAFVGVLVPEGRHSIAFTFRSETLTRGSTITFGAMGALLVGGVVLGCRTWWSRRRGARTLGS